MKIEDRLTDAKVRFEDAQRKKRLMSMAFWACEYQRLLLLQIQSVCKG